MALLYIPFHLIPSDVVQGPNVLNNQLGPLLVVSHYQMLYLQKKSCGPTNFPLHIWKPSPTTLGGPSNLVGVAFSMRQAFNGPYENLSSSHLQDVD